MIEHRTEAASLLSIPAGAFKAPHDRRVLTALGGSTDQTRNALNALLARARSMSLRLEEGRILVALGSVDRECADRHFDEARRIFGDCACDRGLAELEEARAHQLAAHG
jgi:hypothetical protein